MNKHLAIISTGRFLQMVIMFLTYRILSTVLSVSDMGVYYFLLSIAGAFGLIFANPIGMYANRMLHSWRDHGTLIKNFKTIILVFLIGSLLTIPFLYIFKSKISLESGQWLLVVMTLVLYVFSTSINGTLVPSLNLLGFTNQFVLWTLMTNLVGLIISYLMVKLINPQPLYWLIGQGISFIFFGVLSYFILSFKFSHETTVKLKDIGARIKKVVYFGLPIAVTNIAVWGLAQSFRFFYKENIDPIILGELTFGLGLATSLCVAVEYLFQQLYFPSFYSHINKPNEDKEDAWNLLLNRLMPSYIYLLFFLIGLAPFVLRVLADTKFKNSSQFLALGAFVEIVRMVGNIFTMATQSELKTHKAMGPYLLGGSITIISILFISHHPEFVSYTPYCLMCGYLGALIYLYINVSHLIKVKIPLVGLLKNFMVSTLFLTAMVFNTLSSSFFYSVLICLFYGLFFLYLLYHSYQNQMLREVVDA